jgi:hypothetical protein
MVSPKANIPPAVGVVTVTVGDVLPAVIVALARSDLPPEDVTVNTTVYLPAVA